MTDNMCVGQIVRGVKLCKVHDVELVDRATLEAKHGKLEQPQPDPHALYCPVSSTMLSFSAVDDALEDLI